METKFKETEIGRIPENWEVKRFVDVLVLQRGFDLPVQDRKTGEYPVMASNGVIGYHNEYKVKGPGVITGRSGTLGKVHYVESDYWPLNTTLYAKEIHSNSVRFLYYFLQSLRIERYGTGTGVPTLNRNVVHKVRVSVPQLPEQRKIADILSTVDETIEKADTIIQETHQLKKGLMQKLFTEGIGHTRFKETKIGRIPEEWEVLPVGQIAKDTLLGTNQTSNTRAGIPLMKMGNVARGQFVFNKVEYVDKETAASLQGFALRDGDFLFNTRNTPELVGKSAVWKAKYGYAIYNNNLLRIGFKKNIIHSADYVSFWMNSHRGLSQLRRLVSGTTSVAAIYWKELRKYPVPVPSLEEQERITKILLEVDSKSEAETTYKLELEQLKKGLMQILLTGKVRVKD